MGAIEDILGSIDSSQLAAALGTDEATARSAAAAAIPTLINSLQANADSADGASSLLGALEQHAGSGLYGDSVDLNAVDTDDGQKIVAHALADDPNRLQAVSGLGGGLLSKLLPLLAPIVMSYLASRMGMGSSTSQTSSGSSANILGDLLGGLFGGGAASSAGASGGGLGDILGQILGGGAGTADTATASAGAGYGSGAQAGADGSLGDVFNAPGNATGMQIPTGTDDASAASAQQGQTTQQGSGDILGDLLGQILGR
ncbi:MAG: DUF937 domain-containing protein [Propionicimonas sp.]|uniref:DUF937 domain-containing protein n=1 Tax=Propionicimonas sp. TaxID=1955623 RepID=UPI003D0A1421